MNNSSSLACERRRISGCRLSSPKNNVCELEPGNDFRDVASFLFGQSDYAIEWNSSATRAAMACETNNHQ